MNIRDLLDDRSCTAACITAATKAHRCTCACAGRHHGLIATASIDGLLDARRTGLSALTDLEVLG